MRALSRIILLFVLMLCFSSDGFAKKGNLKRYQEKKEQAEQTRDLKIAEEALSYAEKAFGDDSEKLVEILRLCGDISYNLGRGFYHKGINYYGRILDIVSREGYSGELEFEDVKRFVYIYRSIYEKPRERERANDRLNAAIARYKRNGSSKEKLAEALALKGELALLDDDVSKAIEHYKQAVALAEEISEKPLGIVEIKVGYAEALRAIGGADNIQAMRGVYGKMFNALEEISADKNPLTDLLLILTGYERNINFYGYAEKLKDQQITKDQERLGRVYIQDIKFQNIEFFGADGEMKLKYRLLRVAFAHQILKAYIAYLDGEIGDARVFIDQANNLVRRIAFKEGYVDEAQLPAWMQEEARAMTILYRIEAAILTNLGRLDQAHERLNKAVEINGQQTDLHRLAKIRRNRAEIDELQGNFVGAIRAYHYSLNNYYELTGREPQSLEEEVFQVGRQLDRCYVRQYELAGPGEVEALMANDFILLGEMSGRIESFDRNPAAAVNNLLLEARLHIESGVVGNAILKINEASALVIVTRNNEYWGYRAAADMFQEVGKAYEQQGIYEHAERAYVSCFLRYRDIVSAMKEPSSMYSKEENVPLYEKEKIPRVQCKIADMNIEIARTKGPNDYKDNLASAGRYYTLLPKTPEFNDEVQLIKAKMSLINAKHSTGDQRKFYLGSARHHLNAVKTESAQKALVQAELFMEVGEKLSGTLTLAEIMKTSKDPAIITLAKNRLDEFRKESRRVRFYAGCMRVFRN